MDWGCEWRNAKKRWAEDFCWFLKKSRESRSDAGRSESILSLGEARVGFTRCAVRGGVRWNSQYSKNCVSLSSCWKPKSQEGNKSFVPELKKVVSVSGFRCIRTFHESVYCTYSYLGPISDMLQFISRLKRP